MMMRKMMFVGFVDLLLRVLVPNARFQVMIVRSVRPHPIDRELEIEGGADTQSGENVRMYSICIVS